jgi:hypothetical protein
VPKRSIIASFKVYKDSSWTIFPVKILTAEFSLKFIPGVNQIANMLHRLFSFLKANISSSFCLYASGSLPPPQCTSAKLLAPAAMALRKMVSLNIFLKTIGKANSDAEHKTR